MDLVAFFCPECLVSVPQPLTVLELVHRAGVYMSGGVTRVSGGVWEWGRIKLLRTWRGSGKVESNATVVGGDRRGKGSDTGLSGHVAGDGEARGESEKCITLDGEPLDPLPTSRKDGVAGVAGGSRVIYTVVEYASSWWENLVEEIGMYIS